MAEEKKKKDRSKWFREMRSELKKVVWPTASTTAKNTGTVLLCSLAVGACIWIFGDWAGVEIPAFALLICRKEMYADEGSETERKLVALEELGEEIG